MKHFESVRKDQLHSLLQFWDTYQTTLSSDQTVVTIFTQLEAFQTQLNDLEARQKHQGKAITATKQEEFDSLIAITSKCDDLLFVYGNLNQFADFSNIAGTNKYELSKSTYSNILAESRKLSGIIQDHSEKAAAAGITDELKTELEDSISRCDDVIDTPKDFRKNKHAITQEISDVIEEFTALQDNNLSRYMRAVYQDSNASLYTDYEEASQLEHAARQKVLLKGTFTDEEGLAVRNVRITIDGVEVGVRGGKKGGFHFTNISKGYHELSFHKSGYLSQSCDVVIHADRCVSLNISLASESKVEVLSD